MDDIAAKLRQRIPPWGQNRFQDKDIVMSQPKEVIIWFFYLIYTHLFAEYSTFQHSWKGNEFFFCKKSVSDLLKIENLGLDWTNSNMITSYDKNIYNEDQLVFNWIEKLYLVALMIFIMFSIKIDRTGKYGKHWIKNKLSNMLARRAILHVIIWKLVHESFCPAN